MAAPPARALLLALAGALLVPPAARGKCPSPRGSPGLLSSPGGGGGSSPRGHLAGGARGACAESPGVPAPGAEGSPCSLRCQCPGMGGGAGGSAWLGARKMPARSPDGTASGLLASPLGCPLPGCLSLDSYTWGSGWCASAPLPDPLLKFWARRPPTSFHFPPPRMHLGGGSTVTQVSHPLHPPAGVPVGTYAKRSSFFFFFKSTLHLLL